MRLGSEMLLAFAGGRRAMAPASLSAIGAAAGGACYLAVSVVKAKLQYDDTLDAFGVHGVCGFLGAVLTGVFAEKAWNPAGQDGIWSGNVGLVVEQLIGLVAAGIFAAVVSYVLLKVIDVTVGLRATTEDEQDGLDVSQHGEQAYSFNEGASGRKE